MAKLDITNFTKEQLNMAMQCETAEELIALAKQGGYEVTKEEAEAFLLENEDCELDEEDLDNVAGGTGENTCPDKSRYSLKR